MKISFLGQGFEPASANAVGNYLMKYIADTSFHSFIGISAFASEIGVYGLSTHIKKARHLAHVSFIVGVDQGGTSKEALEEILALNIDGFIYYQAEAPIFHPKIYLFEGAKKTKLILGSSNLTGTGLFTNVESSLLIEFDVADKEGQTLLKELKNYYKTLFNFKDQNLFKINHAVIADFVARGIVPDEATRSKSYNKKVVAMASTPITTTTKIPKRVPAKIPAAFPRKPTTSSPNRPSTPTPPIVLTPAASPLAAKTLVWQKVKLSQSDAQAVPAGTKITGNLKLSQARFKIRGATINQTTYFRNHVFNGLNWARAKGKSNPYEEVVCPFDLTILGQHLGIVTLKLSHDPGRIAGQGNTPTWLHWGSLMPILQKTNVTDRTLNLYQLGNQSFSIEIV